MNKLCESFLSRFLIVIVSLSLIASCKNNSVSVNRALVQGSGSTGLSSSCDEIKTNQHFNGGTGTVSDPYLICSEQQFLNISLAVTDSRPSLISAGTVKFPYMNKSFKLGKNINFSKSDVEFFSLGHFMASVGRSSAISGSDKYLIATHDQRNLTDYIAKLASQRIPFTGEFNGDNNTIEVGDYAPTESRLVGLFSALSLGASVKNLVLKNFHVYAKGGVNVGCLVGSILKSEQTTVWRGFGIFLPSKKIVLDRISIDNCSLNDVVSNSAALVGLIRTYHGEELSVSNIALSNIFIDGGAETKLEPAYGDDLLQSAPVLNRMHNVGALAGYVQIDGKATFSDIAMANSEISLESFYTGLDRALDMGDIGYNSAGSINDVAAIYSLFDTGMSDEYLANDPANSVGALFGAFNTSSNLARVNVQNISVTNSQTNFLETTRASGTFAGSIALLGGIVSFQGISLKNNVIKFGVNDFSLPSSGVGLMAGVLSIGSSGANYSFNKIQIDGHIQGDNAESSGDISGFFGSVNALDEDVAKNNKISFSEIDIAGSAVLGGVDIRSLGSFAGSLSGKGNLNVPSLGSNLISLSKVNNDFDISTPDNYSMAVGGLVGYLGSGVYSLDEVVVRTQIGTTNQYGFYNFVNSIVGMFSSEAQMAVTNSSYDSTLRPEFVTGIPTLQDNFVEL